MSAPPSKDGPRINDEIRAAKILLINFNWRIAFGVVLYRTAFANILLWIKAGSDQRQFPGTKNSLASSR